MADVNVDEASIIGDHVTSTSNIFDSIDTDTFCTIPEQDKQISTTNVGKEKSEEDSHLVSCSDAAKSYSDTLISWGDEKDVELTSSLVNESENISKFITSSSANDQSANNENSLDNQSNENELKKTFTCGPYSETVLSKLLGKLTFGMNFNCYIYNQFYIRTYKSYVIPDLMYLKL